MSVYTLRRENLKMLASRTQTKLAEDLEHDTLNQRRISYIVRGEKQLQDSEARYIETKLGIPAGWMDKYSFDVKTMMLIRKFRKLDSESKDTTNKLLQFVEGKKGSGE